MKRKISQTAERQNKEKIVRSRQEGRSTNQTLPEEQTLHPQLHQLSTKELFPVSQPAYTAFGSIPTQMMREAGIEAPLSSPAYTTFGKVTIESLNLNSDHFLQQTTEISTRIESHKPSPASNHEASPSSQVDILLNCLRDMDKDGSLDIPIFQNTNTDIVRNTLRLREAVASQDEIVGPDGKWPKDILRQFAFLAARNDSFPNNTREFMNKNNMGFTASEFLYVKNIAKSLHSMGNIDQHKWPKDSMISYVRSFTSNSLSKQAKRKEDYNKAMENTNEFLYNHEIDINRKYLDNSFDKNRMEKQWKYFNKKNKKGELDNEIANLRSALSSFKALKKQNKEKAEEIEAYNCQMWLQLINPIKGARKPKIPEGASQDITNIRDAKEALYNLLKHRKTKKSYSDTETNFESALNEFQKKAQEESSE